MAAVTRLLETIIPNHYALKLDVDLDQFAFTAAEEIDFTLKTATNELVFHAVGLNITKVSLEDGQAPLAVELREEDQTVAFRFDEAITAGQHTLELHLSGVISESLHGFYRSRYESKGREQWLATTQFEAIHAREAFVCIDEPAAKAVFELSVTTADNLTVIANTHVVREAELESGRRRFDFAPTPKMSTYLVAYLIGEFEYTEAKTPEGVTVRVYATAGKREQTRFALDIGVRTLSFYNQYFGIAYPLAKLDMIAVPDFASGAMENWGAVTYRETALLLDDASASLGNRQRVVEVIAHELAHQWFGNLVTMSWWNDLWLNEGFASWVEVLAQDHLFPEWDSWTQFAADHYARAMEMDSLANTHPIEVAVDDPRHLDEIFDAVSYSKGASVINMLHHYLGAKAFQRGLQQYLKQHSYGNTVTTDLWRALEEASKQPVAEVMAAWTGQPGYPIVELADGQLSQRRFFASPLEAERTGKALVWPIPLRGLAANGNISDVQLFGSDKSKSEPAITAAVKLNPGQTAFYRVHYDQMALARLTPLLAEGKLGATDRFGVTSDVFAGTEAGQTSSDAALTLTSSLRHEDNYVVWAAVAGGFGSLTAVVEDDTLRDRLDSYGRWLIEPNLQRLGWNIPEDEPHFDGLMRPLVLQQAVRYGNDAVIAEAKRRFAAHVGGTPIPADLRPAVYYAVAAHGNEADFETMLGLYRQEQAPQERMRLLGGLSRFREPVLVQRALDLGLSYEVRPQDTIFVLAWGLTNRYGRQLAWQFIQDKWPTLLERYGSGGHMLEHIPLYVGQAFATHAMADEIEQFFTANAHPSIARPVAQALESVRLKADWYKRDQAKITAYLTQWETSNPSPR